jgi:hypothetical protein
MAECRTGGVSRRAAAFFFSALLALVALLLPLAPGTAGAEQANLETAYVVLGADGAMARAVLPGAAECPRIEFGGAAAPMSVRARPDAAFPVLVCEALIPPGTASAAIEGRALPLPKPGTWLLSHRPIWAIGRKFKLNQTLEQALAPSDGKLPQGIELVLSGHLHIFELLSFTDQRPPQLVVGRGGTALDRKVSRNLDGQTIGGATVRHGRSERRFGFLMIRPQNGATTATFLSPRGAARLECTLPPSKTQCN